MAEVKQNEGGSMVCNYEAQTTDKLDFIQLSV